jgi:hypothetical protein
VQLLLTLNKDSTAYTLEIPLNNPTFYTGHSNISYEDGILKITDNTVDVVGFTVQTGNPGFVLEGSMYFYYYKGGTYDPLAVQRINDLITVNGLRAYQDPPIAPNPVPDNPWFWDFAEWNDEEPRQITRFHLGNRNLQGVPSFAGLTTLQHLHCGYNFGLFGLDLTDCTGLISLGMNRSDFGFYPDIPELDLSHCTKLESLSCDDNFITELDLTNNTKLRYLVCSKNRLSKLDLKNNTELYALFCDANRLTELDLTGVDNIWPSAFAGYAQSVSLTLTGKGNEYTLEIPLNNPIFQNSAISYSSGVLKSTDKTVSSTNFWVQAIGSNYYIDGRMFFSYEEIPPSPPVITTTALPYGTTGEAYTAALEADGDVPITWSIESGTLPADLTLNETTGIISGIPTVEGIFEFTVKATNEAGSDTKPLPITVSAVGIGNREFSQITVYPNPTTGELRITNYELRDSKGINPLVIEIFDVFGQKVYGDEVRGERYEATPRTPHHDTPHLIDISHLPSGVYFLRIQTDDDAITQKIIKK